MMQSTNDEGFILHTEQKTVTVTGAMLNIEKP